MELLEKLLIVAAVLAPLLLLAFAALFAHLGAFWIQAYMSGADVSMQSLITMSLLRIDHRLIVTVKIMAVQSGIPIDRKTGVTTNRLVAHHLSGGNIMHVIQAIIVAQRAGMDLDFDRAAAIDLSGRDVLLAVRTSVTPVVISCPRQDGSNKKSLSAVARNGVEVLVGLKVTVRTNLDQLVGGATEETIIARVGHAIVAAVGSAESHMEVIEVPSRISARALSQGLDAGTAYSIISIDVSTIDLGENIGARLQTDQASADTLTAQAIAESRRAEAVAQFQEMKAAIKAAKSDLMLANALVPAAMANAFRAGQVI